MSDLCDDPLELPTYLLIKLLNLLAVLSGCLELWAQAGLQHTLEEVHPGSDALRHTQEIWRNHKLHRVKMSDKLTLLAEKKILEIKCMTRIWFPELL